MLSHRDYSFSTNQNRFCSDDSDWRVHEDAKRINFLQYCGHVFFLNLFHNIPFHYHHKIQVVLRVARSDMLDHYDLLPYRPDYDRSQRNRRENRNCDCNFDFDRNECLRIDDYRSDCRNLEKKLRIHLFQILNSDQLETDRIFGRYKLTI